jgi:hypothetical protein
MTHLAAPIVAVLGGVDLFTALVVAGFAISVVVVVLSVATFGIGVRKNRLDNRREDARRRVRGELFERRTRENPEWEQWVDGLDSTERDQLETLLDRFLRTVSGSERALYISLAERLEMGRRGDETLDERALLPQLRALSRLTLLNYSVTAERLIETSLGRRETREVAARLLYERREEFERPAALGTAFLLWHGQRPLTARGLQTLYEFNDGWPIPLLSQARWSATEWNTTVLTQVCRVLGQCQTTAGVGWFGWLFELFDHEEPRVRAAAVRACRQVGWRETFHERIPFRELIADDDPRVRRATYRVLTYWGDDHAHQLLEWAVIDEDDPRAQLVAVRGLVSLEADPMGEHPAWPNASWDWIRAEIEATERRRMPSRVEVSET